MHVSFWYQFSSAWRTSFNIFLKNGSSDDELFLFFVVFVFLPFLKDIFAGYRSLCWHVLWFLKMLSTVFSFASFSVKNHCHPYFCFSIFNVSYFLWLLLRYPVIDIVQFHYDMYWCSFLHISHASICLYLLDLWVYGLHQTWNILGYSFSKNFFLFPHPLFYSHLDTPIICILGCLKFSHSSLMNCS